MKVGKLLICCAVFCILVGCGKQEIQPVQEAEPETLFSEAPAEPTPQPGGTLKLSMRLPKTLNPLVNEDETVGKILQLIFEPLINVDKAGKPSSGLAESWSVSEDGKTLTLQLSTNLHWQDGTSITADDVVYSLNAIRSADNNLYKRKLTEVSNVWKSGSNVVNVSFQTASGFHIYDLEVPIVPAAYYRNQKSEKFADTVGSGGFSVASYTPAKELRLKKESNCFGKTPYIDEVSVIILPDQQTEYYAFDTNVIDVIATDELRMGKFDNFNEKKKKQYTTNFFDFIGFNFRNAKLQNLNVRKAIAFALPKQKMIENIYLNHATAASGPIHSASWLYEPQSDLYAYNLGQAVTLLDQAYCVDTNGDGVREFGGDNLAFSVLVNSENEERRQVAIRLSEELKSIGILLSIEEQPYEIYSQKLAAGDFDLYIGGFLLSPDPDFDFMLASGGVGNFGGYHNTTMDAALYSMRHSVTEMEMKQNSSNFQKFFAEELPYIGMVFHNYAVCTSSRINGNIQPLENNIFYQVENWFITDGHS